MVLKKIALTGASGMIGSQVISTSIERGISCVATSRTRPKRMPNESLWLHWDLRDWKSIDELNKLFSGSEALVHVGASVPRVGGDITQPSMFDANVRACLCLGEWALRTKIPMVYLSGSTVYADPYKIGIKETDPKTSNGLGGFYGFSKLLAEELLLHLTHNGLMLCILRPSSVYGYGLPKGKMITNFIDKAMQGETIELRSPIEDKIDLIHANDVANAILKVLECEIMGIFNIATENPQSVYEIAETCVRVVGKGNVKTPKAENCHETKVRFSLNCEAARKAFGYLPELDLTRGIEKMWKDMNADL